MRVSPRPSPSSSSPQPHVLLSHNGNFQPRSGRRDLNAGSMSFLRPAFFAALVISTSFLLPLFLFTLQGPPLLKGKRLLLAQAFMFRALTETEKCNAKAGVCTTQTSTGMTGVGNGWQWSNRQPNTDYGKCSVQCSPELLFFNPFLAEV